MLLLSRMSHAVHAVNDSMMYKTIGTEKLATIPNIVSVWDGRGVAVPCERFHTWIDVGHGCIVKERGADGTRLARNS
jgi:hypothetical protein